MGREWGWIFFKLDSPIHQQQHRYDSQDGLDQIPPSPFKKIEKKENQPLINRGVGGRGIVIL